MTISTARAWKPLTHESIAEQALQDAKDGYIDVYDVDYFKGGYKKDLAGKPHLIGRYSVRTEILDALIHYPDQFRAGVIGPDAFPDMLTGQELIHPAGHVTPGETEVDLNRGGAGSGRWLDFLWRQAYSSEGDTNDKTPQARAFVAGIMSHAAGDIYAHTLINKYTGGAFHFPLNGIRHITLEGYLEKRTPLPQNWSVSVKGIEGFIYRNMIDARLGSVLQRENLLRGEEAKWSIPFVFSYLRDTIQITIDQYSRELESIESRIKNLGYLDSKRISLTAEGKFKSLARAYLLEWLKDIDDGLKSLPDYSLNTARTLSFTQPKPGQNTNSVDTAKLMEQTKNYAQSHLFSMMGAPDFVGLSLIEVQKIQEYVISIVGVPHFSEYFNLLKSNIYGFALDKLNDQFTGGDLKYKSMITRDKDSNLPNILLNLAQDPVNSFNLLLDNQEDHNPIRFLGMQIFNAEKAGSSTNLNVFNFAELGIIDDGLSHSNIKFNWTDMPTAYNSILLTKLSFLPKQEVNRLMRDLLGRDLIDYELLKQDNIMLGFIETLDGSRQWSINEKKMSIARNCDAYTRIFMRVSENSLECQSSNEVKSTNAVNSSKNVCVLPGKYAVVLAKRPASMFDPQAVKDEESRINHAVVYCDDDAPVGYFGYFKQRQYNDEYNFKCIEVGIFPDDYNENTYSRDYINDNIVREAIESARSKDGALWCSLFRSRFDSYISQAQNKNSFNLYEKVLNNSLGTWHPSVKKSIKSDYTVKTISIEKDPNSGKFAMKMHVENNLQDQADYFFFIIIINNVPYFYLSAVQVTNDGEFYQLNRCLLQTYRRSYSSSAPYKEKTGSYWNMRLQLGLLNHSDATYMYLYEDRRGLPDDTNSYKCFSDGYYQK